MMQLRFCLTTAVLLVCLAVGSVAGAQDPALRLFARAEPSFALVYAPPAPVGAWSGSRLFFAGDPLTLEMEIWNQAGAPAVLVAEDPRHGVRVRVRRQEGRMVFDGPIVEVPVRYHDQPSRVYQGAAQPAAIERRMPLAADEAIRWSADIDIERLEPGLYVFELIPTVTEESGIRVSAYVNALAFEVRARTPDAAREIMLRAGERAMLSEDYAEAERLFQDMQAAFPESAIAARSLGMVYHAQKKNGQARQMFERAREILRTGADVALTRYRADDYRGDALAGQLRALDEQIERLR